MSEVIVQMEMPTRCSECDIAQKTKSGLRCPIASKLLGFSCAAGRGQIERPWHCPIVGVLPEQHGRLIDAKHFEVVSYTKNEVEQAGYCWRSFDDGVEWLLNKVDATPTIVPATERSET